MFHGYVKNYRRVLIIQDDVCGRCTKSKGRTSENHHDMGYERGVLTSAYNQQQEWVKKPQANK